MKNIPLLVAVGALLTACTATMSDASIHRRVVGRWLVEVTVLRRADERSRDIYDVWLGDGLPACQEKYRKSIDDILK